MDRDISNIIDCTNIIMTSYGYIMAFFPIYSQMKHKTNQNGISSTLKAEFFAFFVYIVFSLLAYKCYGNNIKPSIFENIDTDGGVLNIIVRLIFIVLFFSSLGFLFMIGKETFLTLILEIK